MAYTRIFRTRPNLMQNNRNDSPVELDTTAKKYFSDKTLQDAKRLIQLSRASISFSKGDPSTYFIISGIVRDSKNFECKVSYKKRLEQDPNGPLSGSCFCPKWNEKDQCEHVACLYLLFYLKLIDQGKFQDDLSLPPIPGFHSFSVSCEEYGTIIQGPHKLVGAPPSATYSRVQYLLSNKKIIPFPFPAKFKGKLIISFESKNHGSFKFKYRDESDQVIKEISLFENLYLFNWKKGECFHLPTVLREVIHQFKVGSTYLEINDLINYNQKEELEKYCEIEIDGRYLPSLKVIPVTTNIELDTSTRKKQISFSITFKDELSYKAPLPRFLSVFAFESGLLSGFKKKNEAYQFISHFTESLFHENHQYKKELHLCSYRNRVQHLLDFIFSNKTTLVYDNNRDVLFHYDNHLLLELISQLYLCFGDLFFRFSRFSPQDRTLEFFVTSSTLFQNLSTFYKKMGPFGLNLFYNEKEVNQWTSRINFERRSHNTDWFDLELHIDQNDLNVMKHVDLEKGLAVTEDQLILFSEQDMTKLRLLKKYTDFEGEEKNEDGKKKFLLPFNRSRIFELFELKRLGVEGALTEQEENLCKRLLNLKEMPSYPLPDSLKDIARPYQITGYHWLRFLHENKMGACLADDMGLGKTLQAISLLDAIYDKIKKVLIVCPVSIILNWEKEIQKFSNMDISIYHGGGRSMNDSKIILTSYGVMKKEATHTFKDTYFDVLILDEVQHLKNIRSLGAIAARKIQANFRICLTGTPVENDLSEFYNILDLCVPGIWGNIGFIKTNSKKKSRLLARKMAAPFILRRTKSQVLTDLPDKIENTVYLNFNEKEKSAYKNQLSSIRNKIIQGPKNKKYGEILKGLLELRKHCLWQNYNEEFISTKIDFLMENLEQIIEEGHQVIVFSQFTTYLNFIEEAVREKHFKISRIDGTQSMARRQKEVDRFQNHESSVFLISLKAGGVGLNLTAASYVFIMDPWWNPAVEAQAIDRAHRIGQKNRLTVYRPIIKDSVEEKVLKLQEYKKDLFYDLLSDSDDNQFSGKLTMKDFEALLN